MSNGDSNEESKDERELPGLFSSAVGAQLGLMAAGLGVIAVGSILLEWATGRELAKMVDLGVRYVSVPLGVGTAILAGLTAMKRPIWAAPAGLLTVVYFALFLLL